MKYTVTLVLLVLVSGCVSTPQQTTTTTTPATEKTTTTTTLFEVDCTVLKEQIFMLMEEANYCQVDSDCVVADFYPGCPFGCYLLVNKEADLTEIKSSIRTYNRCPPKCMYSCALPPNATVIVCRLGECVDTRYEEKQNTTTTTTSTTTIPDTGISSPRSSTTTLPSVGIPQEVLENCIGFLVGDMEEFAIVKMAGGAWARPHPGPFAWQNIQPDGGEYDYTLTDQFVKAAQEEEVALLATLWPYSEFDQKSCHGSECVVSSRDEFYPRTRGDPFAIYQSRCIPCDLESYGNFIEDLVERYDGDGVDDMPNLKMPVKYWEADNEPFLDSETLTFFVGTPEEYGELLKVTYNSVKKACPDCTVLHAGAAHIQPSLLAKWRIVFQKGGINYFDVANIHYISSGDKYTMNVKDFKKLVSEFGDKPIWLTEAEIRSVSELSEMTEGALNAGASRIFYTTINIGQKGPPKPGEYTKEYEQMKDKCRMVI